MKLPDNLQNTHLKWICSFMKNYFTREEEVKPLDIYFNPVGSKLKVYYSRENFVKLFGSDFPSTFRTYEICGTCFLEIEFEEDGVKLVVYTNISLDEALSKKITPPRIN